MPENFSILNALLLSVFTGFGIVVPITASLRTSNLKKIAVKEAFILSAVQVLRVAGILYFVLFCVDAYLQYRAMYSGNQVVIVQSPLFNEYWFALWGSPLMYLLLSQLFWIKKLYIKKAALITFAVMLLILPSQRLLIIITTFYRDYLPSSWMMYQGDFVVKLLLNIVVFMFVVFAVMAGTGKLKKLAE
ncbi:hypothetical protein CHU92_01940 [Flavobacterium cyanobacteriorum]|uniref:Polysulfide reductase n=1 Tax=Flavobacterium cyanobacteriorum TaxID=2022802 RepID=A0A255ZXC6_9FLAO|nr:hypothetical protein [Flavobacterium cyanobacteriorum]OYQ45555.1 hypothetical protein CHU92_01940 [Flavobacterium cyanobacteriorum]